MTSFSHPLRATPKYVLPLWVWFFSGFGLNRVSILTISGFSLSARSLSNASVKTSRRVKTVGHSPGLAEEEFSNSGNKSNS